MPIRYILGRKQPLKIALVAGISSSKHIPSEGKINIYLDLHNWGCQILSNLTAKVIEISLTLQVGLHSLQQVCICSLCSHMLSYSVANRVSLGKQGCGLVSILLLDPLKTVM